MTDQTFDNQLAPPSQNGHGHPSPQETPQRPSTAYAHDSRVVRTGVQISDTLSTLLGEASWRLAPLLVVLGPIVFLAVSAQDEMEATFGPTIAWVVAVILTLSMEAVGMAASRSAITLYIMAQRPALVDYRRMFLGGAALSAVAVVVYVGSAAYVIASIEEVPGVVRALGVMLFILAPTTYAINAVMSQAKRVEAMAMEDLQRQDEIALVTATNTAQQHEREFTLRQQELAVREREAATAATVAEAEAKAKEAEAKTAAAEARRMKEMAKIRTAQPQAAQRPANGQAPQSPAVAPSGVVSVSSWKDVTPEQRREIAELSGPEVSERFWKDGSPLPAATARRWVRDAKAELGKTRSTPHVV